MFFGKGLSIGKILGITIRLDYSWFIIFFLITQAFASQYFFVTPQFDIITSIILGIITSLLIFISALIHELSHSVVGNAMGVKIKRITLFIFGGAAEMSDESPSAKVEFKMAIVGPLASIILGFLMWGLLIIVQNNNWPAEIQVVAESLRYFNFAVGIFNLIPGYPLDGGRIFRSFLWWRTRNLRQATTIAANLGKMVGFGFILIGIWLFIFGNGFSGLWLALIGFFLNAAAGMSEEQSKIRTELSHITVSELMTKDVRQVPSDTTVEAVINNYFLKEKHAGYPVMQDDKLLGMIYLNNIAGQVSLKKDAPVLSFITKLAKNQIVKPHTSAVEALKIMGQYQLPSLPVVDDEKLAGIISQTDLNYFLTLKSVTLVK